MSLDGKTLWFRLFLGRENIDTAYEYVAKMFSKHLSKDKEPSKEEKEEIDKQVETYLDEKLADLKNK